MTKCQPNWDQSLVIKGHEAWKMWIGLDDHTCIVTRGHKGENHPPKWGFVLFSQPIFSSSESTKFKEEVT